MNKNQKIIIDENNINQDKYIFVKLEQDIETLEVLSLKIDQKNIYNSHNADYGVLVGRVLSKNLIGVPNARISIFIPLTDADALNPDIYSIYPYRSPTDKNNDGKRYNLLPRVASFNQQTNTYLPKQPFGSFPIKEEIMINETLLEAYNQYFKFTAQTNEFGDFMLFGIPTGVQTVHLSVDITNIGKYSMTPGSMVTGLGYSPNLFTDNNTKIKPTTNLDDLPNIETQEIAVNVIPFWGDSQNFDIGITRQDFKIKAEIINTFTIFGTAFTDGVESMWGFSNPSSNKDYAQVPELHKVWDNNGIGTQNLGIQSKRNGIITEKIYYYPNNISDDDIISGAASAKDMVLLDPSEYSSYKRNGDFVYIIKCNRNKVIIDESGNKIKVDNNSSAGAFDQFRGFITFEYTTDDVPLDLSITLGDVYKTKVRALQYKFKIPQSAEIGHPFTSDDTNIDTINWQNQHKLFTGGTIYSVTKFNALIEDTQNNAGGFNYHLKYNNGFLGDNVTMCDFINSAYSSSGELTRNFNVGLIQTNDVGISGNTRFQMVNNITYSDGSKYFGSNYVNMALFFPQVAAYEAGFPLALNPEVTHIRGILSSSHYTQDFYLYKPNGDYNGGAMQYYYSGKDSNNQLIAASDRNTFGFARSDIHYTDFIVVPKDDIINIFNNTTTKGFIGDNTLIGNDYRNGLSKCPISGGSYNGNPYSGIKDSNTYFFKGFDNADCISYLNELGLI